MVINHLNVRRKSSPSRSVLSRQTEFERTRRRLSGGVAPAGIALVLEALAWVTRESWRTGGKFRNGQFSVVRRSSGAWVRQAQLLRTRRVASFRAEARVAAVLVQECRSGSALLFVATCVPFRFGVLKAEFGRTSGNTGLRTEAVVASIGMLEVASRLTLLLWERCLAFRLSRRFFEEAELHRTGCDAIIRAEAIVASIGTLERTSGYAFILRWLLLLGNVPFRFRFEEAELHRASSESAFTAVAVVASIGTLERCSRGALGGFLHSFR